MDPFGHPDLERLGRALRDRFDETLDAEQAAARAAAQRRRTLRDSLLEADGRGAAVCVSGVDGQLYRGTVEGVGADHVTLTESGRSMLVALAHIVSVEIR